MIQWLRAGVTGRPVKVDRERKVLLGYVMAQEGPFKDGRGEFDEQSLREIVRLASGGKGLKSRFGHPDLSNDGVGKYLGRAKNPSLGTAIDARTGKTVKAVRGDLHFDPSAESTPNGNLSEYVLGLAESDPDAISSSLVLEVDEEHRLNKDRSPVLGEDGEPLPPLWRPTRLHASDLVDTGAACDGLLSSEQIAHALQVGSIPDELLKFDGAVRFASQLLDGMFQGQSREIVEDRLKGYIDRYLSRRFGDPEEVEQPRLDKMAERLKRMSERVGR